MDNLEMKRLLSLKTDFELLERELQAIVGDAALNDKDPGKDPRLVSILQGLVCTTTDLATVYSTECSRLQRLNVDLAYAVKKHHIDVEKDET